MGFCTQNREEAADLRQQLAFKMFFAAFCLMFCCLLVSGAPRLIASDHASDIQLPTGRTYISSAPAHEAEGTSMLPHSNRVVRGEASMIYTHDSHPNSSLLCRSDANGNILCAASYMRAVYQAFVLSDGFA